MIRRQRSCALHVGDAGGLLPGQMGADSQRDDTWNAAARTTVSR